MSDVQVVFVFCLCVVVSVVSYVAGFFKGETFTRRLLEATTPEGE